MKWEIKYVMWCNAMQRSGRNKIKPSKYESSRNKIRSTRYGSSKDEMSCKDRMRLTRYGSSRNAGWNETNWTWVIQVYIVKDNFLFILKPTGYGSYKNA